MRGLAVHTPGQLWGSDSEVFTFLNRGFIWLAYAQCWLDAARAATARLLKYRVIAMNQLVGRRFSVGEGEYRIVDALRVGGETMVYAEEVGARQQADRRPRRAAFHYDDIAGFLSAEVSSKPA